MGSDSRPRPTAREHVAFLSRTRAPGAAAELGARVPSEQQALLSSPRKARVLRECAGHLRLSQDPAFSGIYNALSLNVSSQPHRGRVGDQCILRTGGDGSSPGPQGPTGSQGREGSRGDRPPPRLPNSPWPGAIAPLSVL